jgi:hypothetical protein
MLYELQKKKKKKKKNKKQRKFPKTREQGCKYKMEESLGSVY